MLDFSEIHSAHPSSQDPDAFEKFSRQFLEVVYGAKVVQLGGHGGDDGIDLLAVVGNERWLVSCKHTSTRIVGIDDEPHPVGRLQRHGCDVFVTMYSCRRSAAHNRSLESLTRNYPDFKYLAFYDSDIETKLLGSQNFHTWQLASRWFPKSFAKGFTQLVHPLQQYSLEDVKSSEDELSLDAGALGFFSHAPRTDEAARHMIFMANELATTKTHEASFFARIAEFAGSFPGSFSKTIFGPATLHTIFPSWSMQPLVACMLSSRGLKGAHAMCLIWSMWDFELARQFMAAAHQLWNICHAEDISRVESKEQALEMYKAYYKLKDTEGQHVYADEYNCLSMAGAATHGSTLERGYLAGLLAFHPGGLQPSPPERYMIVKLAQQFGETDQLEEALQRLRSLCADRDREYVDRKSPNLAEKLQSLRLCRIEQSDWDAQIVGLNCFKSRYLEEWRPEERLTPALSDIWGSA